MTTLGVQSLRRRLVLAVSLPLILFFGITIVALDAVFRDLADRSLQELLDAQMVALISTAEPTDDGRVAMLRTVDPRLETPGSGLYAGIAEGPAIWKSPSTTGSLIEFGAPLKPGEKRTARTETPDGDRIAVASRGIAWGAESGAARELTFSVAATLVPYERQLWRFRTQVFGWFAVLTVLLLALLAVLLRWTLAPARRLESEIHEIEAGERESLSTNWPQELAGVATNLNALLEGERARITRYRNTLGNLAHSLKTPLAVMRAALGSESVARESLHREVDRINGIVDHQLRRAAASGGVTVGQTAAPVKPIVADLRATLLRAHSGKDFSIENAVPADVQFIGDTQDLTEMLGNIMDNACKWCESRVRVDASWNADSPAKQRLHVVLEDDGPGIEARDRERVLERGQRADESAPGHGLGLAMVRDAVDLYGGELRIDASPWGGARITLSLPGRLGAEGP